MDLKPKTKELLKRMEKCSILPYRWNEQEIIKNLKEIYRLTDFKWPEKYFVCEDIFDERFQVRAMAIATVMARARAMAIATVMARATAIATVMARAMAMVTVMARATAMATVMAMAMARARAMVRVMPTAIDFDFNYFLYDFENSEKANVKFLEIMEYTLRAKEAGLGYMAEDFKNGTLYLCPNPIIKMNENQFHSDQFPAIEWKTQKEYYLNGVCFPKDLWEKVINRKMPFEDILKIQDIDQRTQAMKYGDIKKFFEHTKAELLDKTEKDGELWKIPQTANIFTQDAYFLRYWCPSTLRQYLSGIAPEIGKLNNATEARAWKHRFILKDMDYLIES